MSCNSFPLYICGLARPQGIPKKLSKINSRAITPKTAARTVISNTAARTVIYEKESILNYVIGYNMSLTYSDILLPPMNSF